MKHYFRKIPTFVLQKLEEVGNDITVATVISIPEHEFNNPRYSDLGLKLTDAQLIFNNEFVPSYYKGVYSRKNINGYRIRHPEREKVSKTYYAGERPIFGDYSRGTFSLYITKMVIPYDEIPPREVSFLIELIEERYENETKHYLFKISTNQVLNKTQENFEDELLFNINILQENIGSVNVFNSNSSLQEFLNTLEVNWEIFPPGESNEDLNRITSGMRNLNLHRIQEISERYDLLRSEDPIKIIVGRSGMQRYFGAKFSENLIVFENTKYGNAIYILFENWRELSQLSRLEIQTRPRDQFIRIPHKRNWQEKVIAIIKKKR
jgi:hypothetical protein